jgi:predicted ATPase
MQSLDIILDDEHVDLRNDSPVLWFEECFTAARAFRGTLYGRDDEVERIQQVYRTAVRNASTQSASQLVLISGVTGIGKTALARSLRRQVEDDDGGYFVCGKFDQLQRPEPLSALVEAFTQLLSRIKDRGLKVSDLRDALSKEGIDYEHGGHDLIEMVPALEEVIGLTHREESVRTMELSNNPQSLIAEHAGLGLSTNRWKDLFRLFIRAVSTFEKPLVLLIEDLHWIDECSLDVLHALVEDQKNSGATFVCTFRTSEESTSMSLEQILQDLKNEVQIAQIHLVGLTRTAVTSLVSSVLSVKDDRAAPLAWTIYDWTKGNVFLTWKCLHSLHLRSLICVDQTSNQFHWDMEEILVEMDSVSNVIRYEVEKLPSTLQEYLRIAACLGSKLDEDILRRLLPAELNLVSTFLHDVAETWLIFFDESRGAWCFGHDSVQEATYQLIPENERSAYHYRIGRKLWREFDLDELGQFLFLVVSQLLLGLECLKDKRERRAIAKLCLGAGIRAFQFSNFQASYGYLEQGIKLLDVKAWNNDYELTMDLYNCAAEVANALGRFQDVHRLVDEVLAHSRCNTYSLRAKSTKVHALGRSNKLSEAIELAISVLASLGERLPTNPSRFRTFIEVTTIRRRLRGKTDEMLLRLPLMTDPKKLAAMEMMNLIFFYVVLVKPDLAPIIGCRMVRLSLDHGLSAVSCVGFVAFAASVAAYVVAYVTLSKWFRPRTNPCLSFATLRAKQAFKESYHLGRLGFLLLQKFNAKPWLARVSNIYYGILHGWVRPFSECQVSLLEGYQSGLQSGDTEFGVLCATEDFFIGFDMRPLPELEHEIDILTERMILYGLETIVAITKPIRKLNYLLIRCDDRNIEELADEYRSFCAKEIGSNRLLYLWSFVHLSFLHFLFGSYAEASKYVRDCTELASPFFGPFRGSFVALVWGLADVAHARQTKRRRAYYARKYSKLLLRWATVGEPVNFIGKHYLLEAELAALAGDKARSYNYYIVAISACREGHFLLHTAIATERVAKSLLEWNETERAISFFRDAVALYQEWGAYSKVRHLESEIMQRGLF